MQHVMYLACQPNFNQDTSALGTQVHWELASISNTQSQPVGVGWLAHSPGIHLPSTKPLAPPLAPPAWLQSTPGSTGALGRTMSRIGDREAEVKALSQQLIVAQQEIAGLRADRADAAKLATDLDTFKQRSEDLRAQLTAAQKQVGRQDLRVVWVAPADERPEAKADSHVRESLCSQHVH